MRKASLEILALTVGLVVPACAPEMLPVDDETPGVGGASMGGTGAAGSGGTSATGGSATGGSATGGSGTGGSTTGGTSTGGSATGGSGVTGGSGGSATGGSGVTGGSAGVGGIAGSNATGGSGVTGGAGGASGGTSGASGSAGDTSGGNPNGGSMSGGGSGGGAGGGSGGSAGGSAGKGGTGSGGTAGGSAGKGGTGSGGAPSGPDCNAAQPSGGQQRSGNGTGGQGNLAWEIWSNTGQGELTTYGVPAFIATWNEAGGYLGRLGFEWNRFGDDPVPHTQRGTISAQFVAKKSGNAGGYSYIGMYGWTTNPCVEWYVVEDSFNPMPINPGMTTNKGEKQIDGGTYVIYTRPTTGSGGSRCSGTTNWIQYYSVRKTARNCGVISLSQHFNEWQNLGMDMTGELLEAKVLVEVGGGTGNVQLPVANVTVQ